MAMCALWKDAIKWYLASENDLSAPDKEMTVQLSSMHTYKSNNLSLEQRCLLVRMARAYALVMPKLYEDHIHAIHSHASGRDDEEMEELERDVRSELLERQTNLDMMIAQMNVIIS